MSLSNLNRCMPWFGEIATITWKEHHISRRIFDLLSFNVSDEKNSLDIPIVSMLHKKWVLRVLSYIAYETCLTLHIYCAKLSTIAHSPPLINFINPSISTLFIEKNVLHISTVIVKFVMSQSLAPLVRKIYNSYYKSWLCITRCVCIVTVECQSSHCFIGH